MNTELTPINFDELVSLNNISNNRIAEDKPMSKYLQIKSLNSLHEYNLTFFRLIKTLRTTKITRAYYLRYYLANIYRFLIPYFIYGVMLFSYLSLFILNIDIEYKMYGIFVIGGLFVPLFYYIILMRNLELNLHDISTSKLLKPLDLFLGKKTTGFNYLSDKSIKLLRTKEYIHTLALLRNFRNKEPQLIKELGIFNVVDFDTFLDAISNNNKTYLQECFLKFGIYLQETGAHISEVTKSAKRSKFLSEEEESNFIYIELQNEDRLPENPIFSKDPSIQKKIYEENIWSKKHKDLQSVVEQRIASIYSPHNTENIKNTVENIKKYW